MTLEFLFYLNFYKAPQGWIRTAAAPSQKKGQKQPSGLFLAARLAQSTRAHKEKDRRRRDTLAGLGMELAARRGKHCKR